MAIDGIFFPAAGDTVSGGVGEAKGSFILQNHVQRVWEKCCCEFDIEEYFEMLNENELTWILTPVTIRREAAHRLDQDASFMSFIERLERLGEHYIVFMKSLNGSPPLFALISTEQSL